MSIPLWLPWAVAAALLLTAFFATALRRLEQKPSSLEFLGRTWSASLVAVVVAGALTLDHVRVSEDELYDAADRAAAAVDGSASESLDLLRFDVEDRLGREVFLDNVDTPAPEEEGQNVDYYVLRPSEQSGAAVCVELTTYSNGFISVSIARGACEGA
jgi:hypothetical protein